MITFVRHGMPAISAGAQPGAWMLADESITASAALDLSPVGAVVVSSPETKAVQTTALATGLDPATLTSDPAFREIDRSEATGPASHRARRAWLSGVELRANADWEPMDAAVRRFDDGIRRYASCHLIIGTHGMVLTAWLVAHEYLAPGEAAVDYWERLPFPAVVRVADAARTVTA